MLINIYSDTVLKFLNFNESFVNIDSLNLISVINILCLFL